MEEHPESSNLVQVVATISGNQWMSKFQIKQKLSKIISITSNRKTNTLTGICRDLSSICLLLNLIQFPCNFWWKCQVLSFWRRWLVPFCPPFFHNPGITGSPSPSLRRYGMTGPLSFMPMASRNVPKAPARKGPFCFAKWENLFWLRSHRIHVWYIYLHLVDFTLNVGIYIPYMDGMGVDFIFFPLWHGKISTFL